MRRLQDVVAPGLGYFKIHSRPGRDTSRCIWDEIEPGPGYIKDTILKIYSRHGDTRTGIFVEAQWIIKIRKQFKNDCRELEDQEGHLTNLNATPLTPHGLVLLLINKVRVPWYRIHRCFGTVPPALALTWPRGLNSACRMTNKRISFLFWCRINVSRIPLLWKNLFSHLTLTENVSTLRSLGWPAPLDNYSYSHPTPAYSPLHRYLDPRLHPHHSSWSISLPYTRPSSSPAVAWDMAHLHPFLYSHL